MYTRMISVIWRRTPTASQKRISWLILQQKIIDLRKEVEQAERVRSCIEKLLKENRKLTQMKNKS